VNISFYKNKDTSLHCSCQDNLQCLHILSSMPFQLATEMRFRKRKVLNIFEVHTSSFGKMKGSIQYFNSNGKNDSDGNNAVTHF
jgi:hypothetical protein